MLICKYVSHLKSQELTEQVKYHSKILSLKYIHKEHLFIL